jgi:signal transduction histidine kinase
LEIEKLNIFQNMSFKNQLKLKELEKEQILVKNKNKLYALAGFLTLLFLLSSILYYFNHRRRQTNRILKKALNDLKSTQNQLIQKEKLASLGELTAGIAHEIQNPLNFVNNFSELSVDLAKELNEELDKNDIDKSYIKEILGDLSQNQEKINHHGKRASNIVKNMLEHSRADSGERQSTDINALVDEYLRLSFHGMRAKDKSFNADFKFIRDENISKINIVPQDIGRVLLNLMNNAFYAVHERNLRGFQNLEGLKSDYTPSVTICTQQLDNQIIIKVIDNGIGMSDAVKAKIFQPFFTTKPTGEGTGLGLSLAYDIVTKGHGGTLEVESNEGIGTEFIIHLPLS